ncbi:TonB-dependent receptor [Acinetobacter indicus]|nr:TonB-dependent receptor [Acinetobacter indicus]
MHVGQQMQLISLNLKNLDTGAALISTPELSVHSALDLQASDALALQMNLQYIGKQYTTETTDVNAWAKAYTLYGVNANYTLNDNVTVRAGISNLFDESMETTDSSEDYYSIQGRTYFVGLTTRF